jgi:hypothetical protein
MDDGIECNTHNSAAGTASSEDDTVGQSSPAEEVLCRSNGNGLQKIVSLAM